MDHLNTHNCLECGSTVTDLVSIKVENDNVIKLGKFFNGNWICDDCFLKQRGIESESIAYSTEENDKSKDIASSRDVSPNTPPA
ncbi:MAG TPA: hypothetical protein VEW92_14615 [Nitrososphaeraceae archaeon]|nr:hypothetical protein [Nitrososphaeraceae archaeon]